MSSLVKQFCMKSYVKLFCSWLKLIKVSYNMSNIYKNFTVLFLHISTNCYYHNSINQVKIPSTRLIKFCAKCLPDISPCKSTWMLIVSFTYCTDFQQLCDDRALDAGGLETATLQSPELLEEICEQQHSQPSKQQNKTLHHTHLYRSRDTQQY
jgi:hypothetical protein